MNYFKILAFSICSLAFVACGGGDDPVPVPDVDKIAPVISLTSPLDLANFSIGTELIISLNISDNIELKNYTIDVDFVNSTAKTKTALVEFTFDRIDENVTGKDRSISRKIEIISNSKTGNYKLKITATDKSDNITSKEVDFNIVNPTI